LKCSNFYFTSIDAIHYGIFLKAYRNDIRVKQVLSFSKRYYYEHDSMLFFIFYFLFFISFTLCSQTPPVISYYLEALGGKSKLMAVRSAKVNSAGRFVSGIDTIKYTSQIFFQRPDKVHLKTKYTHGTKVKVFDGTDFWENALYGDINRLEGDELRMMLERYINFGIEDLIVNAKHYHQKRDTLVDHVEYSRCLVITMNGWELDCYFDPRSHLPLIILLTMDSIQ